jgi:hypothetical protein
MPSESGVIFVGYLTKCVCVFVKPQNVKLEEVLVYCKEAITILFVG